MMGKMELVEKDLDDASNSTQGIKSPPDSISKGEDLVDTVSGGLLTSLDAVGPVLEKFEAVVTLMDKLAEVGVVFLGVSFLMAS